MIAVLRIEKTKSRERQRKNEKINADLRNRIKWINIWFFVWLSWKHDIPLVIKGASFNFIYAINFVRVHLSLCLCVRVCRFAKKARFMKSKNLQYETIVHTHTHTAQWERKVLYYESWNRDGNGTKMLHFK